MDNFGNLYDDMNQSYSKIETLMGATYQDPSQSMFLQQLGSVAFDMLINQRTFIQGYAPADMKNSLLANVDGKLDALQNALQETQNKSL